jgi:SAM-dependent methyltransferase/acyl carrier protein
MLNTIMKKGLEEILCSLPNDRGLRVLEIGAGTGATSSYLLSVLTEHRAEYVFTDISKLFLSKAQKSFSEYPFVKYKFLDIEVDPLEQGFNLNEYDIIVASNVLHATCDLRQSLHHVRKLLSPYGLLILFEGTRPQRWVDLIFGLMDGWWRFTDTDIRQDYPLLPADRWQELLRESNFDKTGIIASGNDKEEGLAPIVLLSQADDGGKSMSKSPRWLLFIDSTEVGVTLIEHLEVQGTEYVAVRVGSEFVQQDEKTFIIDPLCHEHYGQLFSSFDRPFDKVVHLWSLNTPDTKNLNTDNYETLFAHSCRSVLSIVQSLNTYGNTPKLWLVTCTAQAVIDAPTGFMQSPLWGMGKVIAIEHPEFQCSCIDLDGETDASQMLIRELYSATDEDQIAFRRGRRYVARLKRREITSEELSGVSDLDLDHEATYLITGGTGDLGLLIANWMCEQGARHLALIARSLPDEQVFDRIQDMRKHGIEVRVFQADVANQNELEEVFQDIRASMPMLRGVIHSAGVLNDGIIAKQTWPRFEEVFAPKIYGAWNLHLLVQDSDIDFFILFSSAVGMLGNTGQANHAAANIFLDMLAAYRHSCGLPATSIAWGAWSKTGAVSRRAGLSHQFEINGIGNIEPDEGLGVLGLLMHESPVQVGVMPIDWDRFSQYYKSNQFYERIYEYEPQETSHDDGLLLRELIEMDAAEQHRYLLSELTIKISDMLQVGQGVNIEPRTKLLDLGVDSLMALEFKKKLERDFDCALPATLVFDYPNIEEIARFIELNVLDQNEKSTAVGEVNDATAEKNKQQETLDDLTEEELLELLSREIGESIEN